MWIVVDWADTGFYGPFESEMLAIEWLADQGIDPDAMEDNELSINALRPLSEKIHLDE